MKRFSTFTLAMALSGSALAGSALAADGRRPPPPKQNGEHKTQNDPYSAIPFKDATAIQWYATLKRGVAEAERTGRPILFVSGNPSCAGVSGMWCPGKGGIDENYLHKPEVIEAAKQFVCIRLTAYEDESESQFMGTLVKGNVVNTSFNILTPDGKPTLHSKGIGRGPGDFFKDAAEMAKGMTEIAAKYPVKTTDGTPSLPVTLNAKLGLVVAADDNQPFILVVANDARRREELEAQVAVHAWDKALQGRFVYASAASMRDLPKVQGATITEGALIIEPDMFGVAGKVIKEVPAGQIAEQLGGWMKQTVQTFVPIAKANRRDLTQEGLKQGIFHETGIPVSGSLEASDREKYKKKLEASAKPKE